MSDKELFKAIKEYEEKNNLKEVREANKILRKIRDTCRSQDYCTSCPYYKIIRECIFITGVPDSWEIN